MILFRIDQDYWNGLKIMLILNHLPRDFNLCKYADFLAKKQVIEL